MLHTAGGYDVGIFVFLSADAFVGVRISRREYADDRPVYSVCQSFDVLPDNSAVDIFKRCGFKCPVERDTGASGNGSSHSYIERQ
jgi:hypothetical protein